MLIDMHCHTTRSQDSRLDPEEAVTAAREVGLDAVCFTEHDALWPDDEIRALSGATGFTVLAGVEVSTEIGHVLAYGLPEFDLGLRRFEALVSRAREHAAALVLAHPFRRHFRFDVPSVLTARDVAAASRRRGLTDVVALETGNGATRPVENRLAAEVATSLGVPAIAGSDAHAPERVAVQCTEVDGTIGSAGDLAAAVVAGAVRPAPVPSEGRTP